MTVIPGFGGQKFLKDQIYKIKELNEIKMKMKLKFEIEIDGGINLNTSKLCIENGANVLVAGSYIYGKNSDQYKKLIRFYKIMDWNKLKAFYEVAINKSISKASYKLNISQSAISRQIQDLEYDLKTSLFTRHQKGVD